MILFGNIGTIEPEAGSNKTQGKDNIFGQHLIRTHPVCMQLMIANRLSARTSLSSNNELLKNRYYALDVIVFFQHLNPR